jgi:hypothetical protein
MSDKARLAAIVLAWLAGSLSAIAQSTPPVTLGSVAVSGSIRTRIESWSWFDGSADDDYTFPATLARLRLSQARPRFAWQVEFALPLVLGLPDDAIALGAQGQSGLGAGYFAANNARPNAVAFFPKQVSIRLNDLGGVDGQSLTIGRTELSDGAETTPRLPSLAALKRDRIAQRLIGPFGFTHVGRSFDGIQWTLARTATHLTVLAARPTRGVLQVDGWGELDVNLAYGALTAQQDASEWRVFALGYQDRRRGVAKADNRSNAERAADGDPVAIATVGGHYLHSNATRGGPVDVLLWGAWQTGTWGRLDHRALAVAAEVGWQPPQPTRWSPWLRGGYNYGSGDGNANDKRHETFFQLLPTPRLFARFPFFNMMNTADAFASLGLRPSPALTLRTDVHRLLLADSRDLWYAGGGAFQPTTFGFSGRPSNGRSSLATLWDISADYNLGRHVALNAYLGVAAGGPVVEALYPAGSTGRFGYGEVLLRF